MNSIALSLDIILATGTEVTNTDKDILDASAFCLVHRFGRQASSFVKYDLRLRVIQALSIQRAGFSSVVCRKSCT